ncbi:hypothetical protein BHE74_00039410 [Ensete ventricosum]|nr:hypothetical protein GW17_00043403 [Ensete ventricosum]RWW54039.1 hypothetical protein BHE74_00039410 [Ensete ventricosum]
MSVQDYDGRRRLPLERCRVVRQFCKRTTPTKNTRETSRTRTHPSIRSHDGRRLPLERRRVVRPPVPTKTSYSSSRNASVYNHRRRRRRSPPPENSMPSSFQENSKPLILPNTVREEHL